MSEWDDRYDQEARKEYRCLVSYNMPQYIPLWAFPEILATCTTYDEGNLMMVAITPPKDFEVSFHLLIAIVTKCPHLAQLVIRQSQRTRRQKDFEADLL
jgi:hypothetical protein